jgi:hypothetical protein
MTIEQAIRERLLDITPLTALVSTRVYQLKLPQAPTLPAVRIQQISELDEFHFRGPDHLLVTRLQIDAYANEASGTNPYDVAAAVANAIHGDGLGPQASGLSGWTGQSVGSPVAIHVAFVKRLSRQPMYEADELRLVRIRQDYQVHWWAR